MLHQHFKEEVWAMSLPAFGDRKRIEIICLGFLVGIVGILPFSGCAFNRTADDRFPAWAKHSRTQSSPSQTVRTLPSGPAIIEAGPSEGTIASGTAVATDSVSPNDMASLPPPPYASPVLMVSTESAEAKPESPRSGDRPLEVARTVPHPEEKLAAGTVLHVNEDTFEQHVLRSNVPVLVDFYASWCGPCKRLAPTLEQVATESPQAKVVKVDIDNNPKLAAQYGIRSLPSLLVFKDGRVVAKQQGAVAKSRLKAMLAL
jgi:thioredoxin 1